MNKTYLDYAATTPTDERVVAAMLPYFREKFGNPSSVHHFGQESKAAIEESRETIAKAIQAKPEEIIFTSGGTESNNLALKGVAYALEQKGNHLIVSAVEHHAVIEPCEFLKKKGFEVTYIPVDKYGMVSPEEVKKAITEKTTFISIMHANNEIGTLQPIAEIGALAQKRGIYFHTDAVQTFGHLSLNVDELEVDLLSMSAHKLYGPKGIGALYVRKGTRLKSLMQGGEQERGRRASTENVPAIIGFAKAVELALENMEEENKKLINLRQKLINGILKKIPDTHLNGHPEKRLPNNANISINFIEGESILLSLDMEGIAASTGSACTSGSLEPSHVLLALGLPHEVAHGSVRFSLGRYTEEKDIDYLLEVLPKIVERLRAMSPLYKKV